MSDKDDGLGRIFLDFGEEIVALALERLVADGEHLVEHQNIALCFDGHGEGETHLHTRGIVLELLVHEVLKLGELHDVVIHRVDFLVRESQQCAVQIHVLTSGQFRIESDAQLDERHQLALHHHRTLFRHVNLRNDLQQRGFAGTVTADDTEEIALMHFEIDVAQHMLLGVALDALRPVQESHLQTGGLFGGQTEGLGHMVDLEYDRTLINSVVISHRNLAHGFRAPPRTWRCTCGTHGCPATESQRTAHTAADTAACYPPWSTRSARIPETAGYGGYP